MTITVNTSVYEIRDGRAIKAVKDITEFVNADFTQWIEQGKWDKVIECIVNDINSITDDIVTGDLTGYCDELNAIENDVSLLRYICSMRNH